MGRETTKKRKPPKNIHQTKETELTLNMLGGGRGWGYPFIMSSKA